MKSKVKKKRFKKIFVLIIFILIIGTCYFMIFEKKINIVDIKNKNEKQIEDHYNEFVKTNKEADLYDKEGSKIGKVGKNIELVLEDIQINNDTLYFPLKEIKGYYIRYKDVNKIDKITEYEQRYKKYIPFNENIKTKDSYSIYDEKNNFILKLKGSESFPIIIKDADRYGIEYNNKLLYVKASDIIEKTSNTNTEKHNASGVGILNYHAFYDENDDAAKADCTSEICHSKKQFRSHLDFLKENNIFVLKMNELEMYIDGKLQLPKSVLITFDDGGKDQDGIDLLKEYKMYGTIFLVTSWFTPDDFKNTEYIEFHSHTHNMHNPGDCPTGQGGGIQCLNEKVVEEDLATSRKMLNNTTAIAYPFYEYNDYSIEMLKKAGFTMAFIGESNSSDNLVHVNSDKYRLRRFVIVTYTTLNDLKKYFNQIN